MREISSGNPNTNIMVMDEAGQGGACHVYRVEPITLAGDHPEGAINPFTVTFQNGPVNEFGINGCHQEDLLAIVIDRLQSFQSGPYACRENALAVTKIQEAMHWLNHRTLERMKRGVEGTNKK